MTLLYSSVYEPIFSNSFPALGDSEKYSLTLLRLLTTSPTNFLIFAVHLYDQITNTYNTDACILLSLIPDIPHTLL